MIVYSGHGEIVGGDVKFIVDFLTQVAGNYDITLYTDRFCHFEKLASPLKSINIDVHYLDTQPVLFAPQFPLKQLDFISRFPLIRRFFSLGIKGKSLKSLLDFLLRTLTMHEYRVSLHNYRLFLNLLNKRHSDADILLVNNGGYPAKTAALSACLAGANCQIPQILLMVHNIPAARRPFSLFDRLMDTKVNRSVSHFVAVSQILKHELVTKRKLAPHKISVVYCGIEDRPLIDEQLLMDLKRSLGIKEKEKVLLITGSLDERRKGHELLFNSLGVLVQSYSDFKLLVVGKGEDKRVRELEELAAKNSISEKVNYLGFRTDIHELNCLADVVVVPSTGVEATPYTIKEGQRAYKPVITTEQGGCPEGLIDNESGYIINSADPEQLAEKLLSLLRNPGIAKSMGNQGRLFFEQNFELSEQVKKVERLWGQT